MGRVGKGEKNLSKQIRRIRELTFYCWKRRGRKFFFCLLYSRFRSFFSRVHFSFGLTYSGWGLRRKENHILWTFSLYKDYRDSPDLLTEFDGLREDFMDQITFGYLRNPNFARGRSSRLLSLSTWTRSESLWICELSSVSPHPSPPLLYAQLHFGILH